MHRNRHDIFKSKHRVYNSVIHQHVLRHITAPDWSLTYVIVSSVHGILLQTVPHDVPAHEGVGRSLDVLLIVVLLRVDGCLWQATEVHVAWFVFCGLEQVNR